MVTINNEIQAFYDNMNGNLENLNAKISNLMESIDILKKNNASFSESLAYLYKGQAQDTIVQNLTAISNRLDLLSTSINEKLNASLSQSKTIVDSTKQLIELKNKINNETVEDTNIENDQNTFNTKQNDILSKIKELIGLDGLIISNEQNNNQNTVDVSALAPGTYKEYTYTASNGVTVDYYAYIPSNIESVDGAPVHLHLWPSRKNGGPMGYYNVHGLPKLLTDGSTPSGIVICPKLQANEVYDQQHLDAIKELSDSYVQTYNCDKNRISVSGQGGGGQAAINFAAKYPDYFSKVVSLYSLDTANNYDELGIPKELAEYNLTKNNITLIRCTGGGAELDNRSINYTNELYNKIHSSNLDIIDNPHYIYGDDLFSKTFTYKGKSYTNLLEYCMAMNKDSSKA